MEDIVVSSVLVIKEDIRESVSDIRQQIIDGAIRDLLAEEDSAFIRDICSAIDAPAHTFMDAGYIYAPYIPLTRTPDPNNFNPKKGILTRYGKKLLKEGAKYYGRTNVGSF